MIISPWKRASVFLTNFKPLHPRMFCANLEKKMPQWFIMAFNFRTCTSAQHLKFLTIKHKIRYVCVIVIISILTIEHIDIKNSKMNNMSFISILWKPDINATLHCIDVKTLFSSDRSRVIEILIEFGKKTTKHSKVIVPTILAFFKELLLSC